MYRVVRDCLPEEVMVKPKLKGEESAIVKIWEEHSRQKEQPGQRPRGGNMRNSKETAVAEAE